MHKVVATIVFLALACVSTLTGASEATVKAAFQKKFPEVLVENVSKTPLPGIYEIFANGSLIYTDEKVAYLFVNAELIDSDKKLSLSEERLNQLTAIKFDELPLNLAVKKVKGKGTRKLAYFGDPNCGYCKKFEQDLAKINDVTIYVFIYPVLGQNSIDKAKSIWCSKDKVKAWDDQLVNGVAPTAPGTCDTSAIDKTLAYGKQKGVSGTPTMYFGDGQRVVGARPLEIIEQHLAAAK
jgi:thiol:disulfide interchange protein DsbC